MDPYGPGIGRFGAADGAEVEGGATEGGEISFGIIEELDYLDEGN